MLNCCSWILRTLHAAHILERIEPAAALQIKSFHRHPTPAEVYR